MTSPLSSYLPQELALDQAQRIFHGRGHCYPGYEAITLDLFPPALLLTTFKTPSEEDLKVYIQSIQQWWQACFPDQEFNLVWQNRGTYPVSTEVISGAVPEEHWVREEELEYRINLLQGQNHGLFLDMASGRQWVKAQSKHKRVLNLFAYTCAFSVAAAAGGADSVVNLDMSGGALKTGKKNHARNGLDKGIRYLAHDLFKTFGRLRKSGPYDLIIVDPPSFQRGSFIATKDYSKVLRRLPSLLAPEGEALLCLNAPELSRDFLQNQVSEAAPELEFMNQLDNPPAFVDTNPDRALKVLHYRLKNSE
ncbi:class I SAM-dependent methyltransferase [Endozoicomonadaceae bacterium StTr2]